MLFVAFLVAVFHYRTAGDVSTSLAAITGTIGAIVGAFFGVQAGASGGQKAADIAENARQAAEIGRAAAEDKAVKMAAVADPERATQLLGSTGQEQQPPTTSPTDTSQAGATG